jgi:Tfp pilus assembly protein PilF
MNGLLRRPLVVVLAVAFGVVVVYGIWLVWQMQNLDSNNGVAAYPSSAPPPSVVSEPTEAAEPTPVAAHKPIAVPLPASADESVPEEAAAEETGIVFVAHSSSEPASTSLQAAQTALAQNDIAAARQHFSALLKTDPRHLEALLGLAAIALHQNEPETAWRFYQTAWAAYPQDARVQTGMLALLSAAGQLAPQQAESRLKNLIAQQPQAAAPHFALGNLLAGQGRWSEAQAAYFEACRWDTRNPDYRFNLAVSLDALHQSRLAATHYRAALVAAETAPANFAAVDARARLEALQTEGSP